MQRVEAKLGELREASAPAAAPDGATGAASATSTAAAKRYDSLVAVISGTWPIRLNLEFLYWHNATDLLLLKNIKDSFDTRVSMNHSATVMANAFMHAGTTVDTFLRQNLEWLGSATNWAKFGATASLGVIHRGHLNNARAPLAFAC
jgi:26S proteasome regulatory subunit N2